MVPVVGHRHRFGKTLGLVVDAPEADRIHVPPIRLRLWVHERVPVDLGGRGEEEAGTLRQRDPQRVVCPEATDLERLDGKLKVVDRARGRREMQDPIELVVEEEGL